MFALQGVLARSSRRSHRVSPPPNSKVTFGHRTSASRNQHCARGARRVASAISCTAAALISIALALAGVGIAPNVAQAFTTWPYQPGLSGDFPNAINPAACNDAPISPFPGPVTVSNDHDYFFENTDFFDTGGVIESHQCYKVQLTLRNEGSSFTVSGPTFYPVGRLEGGWADLSGVPYTYDAGANPLVLPGNDDIVVNLWFGTASNSDQPEPDSGKPFVWTLKMAGVVGPSSGSTLTVHKLAAPRIPGAPNDGSAIILPVPGDPDYRAPVPDVQFNLTNIAGYCTNSSLNVPAGGEELYYDLCTSSEAVMDDWEVIDFADISDGLAAAAAFQALSQSEKLKAVHYFKTIPIGERVTDSNGEAFWELEPGLYYVWEVATPANILRGVPFFVTVPQQFTDLSDPGNPTLEYNYEVHAYPKNEHLLLTKEVIDSGGNELPFFSSGDDKFYTLPPGSMVGDPINYRITVAVPKLAPPTNFQYFEIRDMYMDWRLSSASNVTVTFAGDYLNPAYDSVDCPGTAPSLASLAILDTDYELHLNPGDGTESNPPYFDVFFDTNYPGSGAGLLTAAARCLNLTGDLKIVVEFQSAARTQGIISNQADFKAFINDVETSAGIITGQDIGFNSNSTTVAYGGLNLWKYGTDLAAPLGPKELEADFGAFTAAALPGARFEVYPAIPGYCDGIPLDYDGPPLTTEKACQSVGEVIPAERVCPAWVTYEECAIYRPRPTAIPTPEDRPQRAGAMTVSWVPPTCQGATPEAIPFWPLTDNVSLGIAAGVNILGTGVDDPLNYGTAPATATETVLNSPRSFDTSEGHVVIGGLSYGAYCVIETQAPDHYSRSRAPLLVEIVDQLDEVYFYPPQLGTCRFGSKPFIPDVNEFDDMSYEDCAAAASSEYKPDWYPTSAGGHQDDYLIGNMLRNAGFPFPDTGGSRNIAFTLIAVVIVGATCMSVRKKPAQA